MLGFCLGGSSSFIYCLCSNRGCQMNFRLDVFFKLHLRGLNRASEDLDIEKPKQHTPIERFPLVGEEKVTLVTPINVF